MSEFISILEKIRPGYKVGGSVEPRQVFYKGKSVEKFLPRIKKLWKEGKGTKAIAKEILGSETQKTTIASAIDAMKSGEAPVKITKADIELNKKNRKFSGVPGKDADKAGLEKAIKEFDGKTRPNIINLARQFGYKDSKAVRSAIKKFGREDIYNLPEPKTQAEIFAEKQAEINKNTITDKEFKAEYKKFKPVVTGSDAEFAKYLNDKGYTARGGKPFTSDSAGSRRERAGISNKGKFVTTRGKLMDDKFILKEVDRMRLNIDTSKMNPEEIRRAVIKGRAAESGKTDAQKEKMYKFRERKAAMAGKKRQFPINIGRNATPKDLFWRDLVENGFRHQAYLQGRPGAILPQSHIKFLNPNQTRPTDLKSNFKIKLVDTNVLDKSGKPKVITYENFPKHLDKNKKLYGIDYDTAIKEYNKKRFIQQNPDLRDEFNKKLNKAYDPKSVSKRSVFSPMHIHHTAGRGRNAFNVQFAVASENMAENNFRRTFNRNFEKAKTLSDKKAAARTYLKSVSPNLEVRLKNTPYGTRETLVDMTKRVAPELTEKVIARGGKSLGAVGDVDTMRATLAGFQNPFAGDFTIDPSSTQLGTGRLGKTASFLKNVAKVGGKALGIAAIPLEVLNMAEMRKQGKTAAEILGSPFFLSGRIGEAQDLMKMTPLERQAVSEQQIAGDESMLDTDFYTPTREGIEAIDVEAVQERVRKQREAEERQRALERSRGSGFTYPNMYGITSVKGVI